MKKHLLISLLCILCTACLFAYTNEQRIISVDSPVYKAMETLYILAGKSLPSSSGPWSENEMSLMLQRIDRSDLNDTAKAYYDYVESLITSTPKLQYTDNFAMQFGLNVNLEGYLHTDTEHFTDEEDWFHGFTSRKPFLKFNFETWPANNFYSYFELTVQHNYGYGVGTDSNPLYGNKFNFNIPIVNAILFSMPSNDNFFADFDWTVPYKAIVSAGGNNWNIVAGRDKLSWGSGETGNLMLSDSFPKQTFAKFSTYFNAFKYSLVFSVYPGIDSKAGNQFESLDGYKALIAHRLEFNLFNNKVGFVINEACMYWSTSEQQFTIAQINPFGFMHNEYVARNGNSLLVFEANYTPINGINVYGQFAIDEFSGPGEGRTNPASFGILAGAKGTMTLGNGILYGSFEFAKTDPFLFIRGQHYQYEEAGKASGYGYDAILRIISANKMTVQHKFVTYTYGNDVIIFDGKINYELPGKFKVGLEAMYMQHGSMNVNSRWGMYQGNYDNAPDVSTPTTFDPFNPDDYDPATDTVKQEHAVETSTILSLSAEYNILSCLSAYTNIDLLIVKNVNNVEGVNGTDVQVTLGASYSL